MRSRVVPAAVLALVAAACSGNTTMETSWVSPQLQPGTMRKVLVLGIARDGGVRRNYEDQFVAALTRMNIQAIPSYQWIQDPTALDTAALRQRIQREGVTHVVGSRMVDRSQETTYVPPTTMSVGYPGYYGGWGSYYSYGYSVSPGYTRTETVVSLETAVWDVSQHGLVWTALSKTYRSDNVTDDIADVVAAAVEEMRAKRVM